MKLVSFFRQILTVVLLAFIALHTSAQIKIGTYYYDLDPYKFEATLIAHNDYKKITGSLDIPETVKFGANYYTVTSIGEGAFQFCSQITGKLSLPNTIKTIEAKAFYNCYQITGNLKLPENLITIGDEAFLNCTELSGTFIIPETVEYIGAKSFDNCSKLIGDLIIPQNVETIGESAFNCCIGFRGKLEILSNKLKKISDRAFYYCQFITSAKLPDTITEIGNYAFHFCRRLKSINIPSSLEIIGDQAFSISSAVTGSINIPASTTNIGKGAFCFMDNVTDIVVDSSNKHYVSENGILYNKDKTILVACPAGLTYTPNVISNIPRTVVELYDYSFGGCDKFTGSLQIPEQIQKIDDYAFSGCKGFNGALILPDNLTSIGKGAFSSCSGFTGDLIIPDNIRSIQNNVFNKCSGFSGTLTLPINLKYIGDFAFEDCSKLTENLIIPDCVETIADYAFHNCKSFSGVANLPKDLLYIGEGAFDSCVGISDFICKSTRPANAELHWVGNNYNLFNATNAKIIVPTNTAEDYKKKTGWSEYAARIYEIGDANLSQDLNVADAVTVANDIIGVPNSTFYKLCADFNSDDKISISDATGIIEAFVYNTSSTTPADAPRRVLGGKALRIDNFSTSGDVANVGVSISGVENMVAMQADFYPTDGVIIEGAAIAPELSATHSLTTVRLANGALRAVVFSAANAPIAADAPILTLEVSGDEGSIEANNIYAAAADGSDTKLGFYGGIATSGVSGVNVSAVSLETTGTSLTICNAGGANVAICNLAGQNVLTTTLKSDRETIELQNGIYIVRIADKSHKIIIR
ncbi:MAG: leucine-rich repeat protein [Bacteroidales bacterium]|nr:leucine-rich repeat protein [Bacteroidales bacterium]